METGAVISAESKARIEKLIGVAEAEGASVSVDGRGQKVPGYEQGSYMFPTLLDHVPPRVKSRRQSILVLYSA